jgi:translation initiation factor IF-2
MTENQEKNLLPRPPIVVVMGHIDHGKTALLDFIRKTNVMAKEAGGITQSIGAYEITHTQTYADSTQTNADSQRESASSQRESAYKITFIDTPGHEVFSKMRARGAKVADLGILVVAADEGVKPQTKEAIKILNESKTPFVVAVNKIDKTNVDIERVKQELMQAGVLLEGFGGNISWQAISAKTGQGINELLDLILLAAEMEGLTYSPEAKASGIIIESKMDSSRGLTAITIIKDGLLRVGDEIATTSAVGKVKILEDFLGERVDQLSPSSPALIIGFETLPQIGEEFFSGKIELVEIKPVRNEISNGVKPLQKEEAGVSVQPVPSDIQTEQKINLILKADVSGSLEALSGIIKTFPNIKIIGESVGDITDGDIKSAQNTGAVIVGFKTRVSKAAENLATAQGIKIITSEIIYELLKNLEDEFRAIEKPAVAGQLEILAVFDKGGSRANASLLPKKSGKRQVVGGRVLLGTFKNNLSVKVQRQGQVIGEGKIINLQCQKQDVSQVSEEKECGLLLESDTIINIGDQIIY